VEILDYLRAVRRRLWLVIGVPVVAVLAVAAVGLLGAQQYTATAYVAAPALPLTGQQAVSQFVAAFEASATSPKVLDEVAKDTGASADNLRGGLVIDQVGASSQLTVVYTSTDRAKVSPVLTATTRRALQFLFDSQVNIASKQVDAAAADVDTATEAIAGWETTNKVSQPDKLYDATLSEISDLRRQQLSMEAVGNSKGTAAAASALADAQKRLDALGTKLPGYQVLLAQRDAATSTLSQAQQALQTARAQSQAADPSQVASVGATSDVSKVSGLVTTVPPAAGAGLLLAVLLVVVLEVAARQGGAEPALRRASAEPAQRRGSAEPAPRRAAGERVEPAAEPAAEPA
jgi:uncharacterized protein involved in exopolysaccharide biosynthesis